jgi:hypothetical protein
VSGGKPVSAERSALAIAPAILFMPSARVNPNWLET